MPDFVLYHLGEVKKRVYQLEDKDRWDEGLANHERLKKLLPFLNEDEGYL